MSKINKSTWKDGGRTSQGIGGARHALNNSSIPSEIGKDDLECRDQYLVDRPGSQKRGFVEMFPADQDSFEMTFKSDQKLIDNSEIFSQIRKEELASSEPNRNMGSSVKISRTHGPSQFAIGLDDSEERKSETIDIDFEFNLDPEAEQKKRNAQTPQIDSAPVVEPKIQKMREVVDSDIESVDRVGCDVCEGKKKRAIGQCTYVIRRGEGEVLFKGCGKNFCKKHGVVEIELKDSDNKNQIAQGTPVLDMPVMDPNVRFCHGCNLAYLDAKYRFTNSSLAPQKHNRLLLYCLGALGLAVVLLVVLIIIAASKDMKVWVKNPSLGAEESREFREFQRNKDLYQEWKDSGKPSGREWECEYYEEYDREHDECVMIECPDYSYLDIERGLCWQSDCGQDFYLDINGKDCHLNCSAGYKPNWLKNGCTEMCRVHEIYNTTDGGCDEIICPRTTQLNKRTGNCDPIICEPWERHSLDGLSCEFRCREKHYYDNATNECLPKQCPDYFYASADGKSCLTKECPDYYHLAKNGEDCLQVHCEGPTLKPDITGKKCNPDFHYVLGSIEDCNGEWVATKDVSGYVDKLPDMQFNTGARCHSKYEIKVIGKDDGVPFGFRYLYFDELLQDAGIREKILWKVFFWEDVWMINGFYDGFTREFWQACGINKALVNKVLVISECHPIYKV